MDTIDQVVSDLYGMKLTSQGDLNYFKDRFGYFKLVFNTSNEFKNYLSDLENENKKTNYYDTDEVEEFLVNLGLIYDKYGYDLIKNINSSGAIFIEPFKDIEDIIKSYNTTMDLSRINRKSLNIKDSITISDIIDNDVIIDNNVKDKFINAVYAVLDILKYLEPISNKSSSSILVLDDLYNMSKFRKDLLQKSSIGDIKLSELSENSVSRIMTRNKRDKYDDNYFQTKNVIKEYIVSRFKEIATTYLPTLKSLLNVEYIDNLNTRDFTVQLEAKSFSTKNLNLINDTMYKYL